MPYCTAALYYAILYYTTVYDAILNIYYAVLYYTLYCTILCQYNI